MFTEADEIAARSGCKFDEERATHFLEFCQTECRLYEGDQAGQLVHLMPWQTKELSRLFGWVRYSEDWGRWVRRFTTASIWIPKKNGKSPTAAMVGLYLLLADGEMGQKVFSAAKDGKQARIVHMHAQRMVEQSERMMDECRINATTGHIAHTPTWSVYSILSGDNITGQEGINGSVIIDETHVVDDRLAKTIRYAGASRSEPIRFEVSTAGDNLHGYGKQQQDYGRLVNDGKVRNDRFLCVIYEAPQDATDAACGKPSTWKQANPSWGHTIREEEFRASYDEARRSKADFASFKKYRLNIWQHAANPWLSADQWEACRISMNIDELSHLPAVVGIDLSKTTDMTAAAWMAYDREQEKAYLIPRFWLPSATVENLSDKIPALLDWADQGHIEVTEGDVIDYSAIERYLIDLHGSSPYREIVFDPTYAEELTQRVANETGVERVAFRQSNQNFAGPTDDFERLVIAGRMAHPGHPVLDWQAGHATVKLDDGGRKRVVKPRNEPTKKVDGIVAAIMALARHVIHPTAAADYYDHYEPEWI